MTTTTDPSASGWIPGRWGTTSDIVELPAAVRAYLDEHVGRAEAWPMRQPDLNALGDPALQSGALEQLAGIVGTEHVLTSAQDRWRSVGGASYLDYVRRRSGDASGLPEAIVAPADHDQVQAVIDWCSSNDVAVVPLGGGTSVVGGLAAARPHIALATHRLHGVEALDPESGLVTVGAGITGPNLEAILAARDLTLGHFPQSWQRASIGGYLATRSAGQASTGYGRSDDMVERVRLATPAGSWTIGHSPASAAGPDLLQVAIGSEGAFGVITQATLRVRRQPRERRYEAWIFPTFTAGTACFRDLAQSRVTADVMRLSDEIETATTLMMSGPDGVVGKGLDAYLDRRGITKGSAALAIIGFEGASKSIVSSRRGEAVAVIRRHGGVRLGRRAGESWRRHRFEGPHLRDALMDAGYLVETVETATTWADLPRLYSAMHEALHGSLTSAVTRPHVMTHVSHVYETGASLYTTVIAVADRDDPVGQWRTAKTSVTDAIMASSGTVTHHHAVGRDHAPWLARDIGDRGVEVLRAIKAHLDPKGICNPGVLTLN